MTSITNNPSNQESVSPDRRAQRMAWLWFGPLIVVVLVQFLLGIFAQGLQPVEPINIAPYVQTAAGHGDAAIRALMWQASKPVLIHTVGVAVLIFVAWLAVRRWGWPRMRWVFTGLWCLAWTCVALWLVASYVNRVNQVALPPVTATVIAAQPYPSSDNAPGGALTWLQPPSTASADGVPWRVKIAGANFQAMPAGTSVTLQRARGPLWGVYLTGSDAPQAQPMPLPGAAPAPGRARPVDPS